MRVIALACVVVLAGCVTAEQQADLDIAEFSPYCEKLGYERNSDKWRDCILSKATSLREGGQRLPIHCVPSGRGMYCY